jgi:hypothetical protein
VLDAEFNSESNDDIFRGDYRIKNRGFTQKTGFSRKKCQHPIRLRTCAGVLVGCAGCRIQF